MCSETELVGEMVLRFSAFQRQSHGGSKAGKGDRPDMMNYGTAKAGHLTGGIDTVHRAETLCGCCLASSYEGKQEPSGTYFIDTVLANASKIHEGNEMAEATRLMVDICRGFVAELASDRDLESRNRPPGQEIPERG
jgi:4-hydroxybutyryl-CoA dehydratase/vinylacetyl-CoA-Delta-isomerase